MITPCLASLIYQLPWKKCNLEISFVFSSCGLAKPSLQASKTKETILVNPWPKPGLLHHLNHFLHFTPGRDRRVKIIARHCAGSAATKAGPGTALSCCSALPRSSCRTPAALPAAGHLQLSLLSLQVGKAQLWGWGCSALLPPHKHLPFPKPGCHFWNSCQTGVAVFWLSVVCITNPATGTRTGPCCLTGRVFHEVN